MKRTNGNIDLIEKELSIPKGNWSEKTMCRVDVDNLSELNLRMSTGNETGANEFFTPGGFTADGTIEAVIDQVLKGNYTYLIIN